MTTTETEVAPYILFRVEVARTERISPHTLRVTFASPDLAGCVSAGHDQRITLAGESSAITDLRRHLVTDRGFAKENVYFSGYWLLGGSIE